jgi:putative heme iron utilization protein
MNSQANAAALTNVQALIRHLRAEARMLHLATAAADGTPEASLVPGVIDEDGHFIVLVSSLARHTLNLQANPRASVLLADASSEAARRTPLATPRLTLSCRVEPLHRDHPQWNAVMKLFHDRFGETIAILSTLADFGCFRLMPLRGRLVAGFGQAYEVAPAEWTQLTRVPPSTE